VAPALLCVVLLTAAAPALTGPLTLTFEELDALVQARAEEAGLPGIAYGVVQDGAVVHTAAFGVAGPDGRPMTTTTVLNTASVGKTFTALAVAQLVAAGDLELDRPVQTYVPSFDLADHEAAAAITVRHLLEHTSGLSTVDGNHPWLLDTGATLDGLLTRIADLRPVRAPGSGVEYCNVNYVLLGAVVEAVTGQGYFAYLKEEVLGPIGMTSTFRTAADARAAGMDVADGYRFVFGVAREADVPMPLGSEAAGMQWTTIEDLAAYAAVFANHGEVGGRSIVTGSAADADVQYDIDWQPTTWLPDDGFGHAGAWITYSAGLEVLPGHEFAVVMLANANPSQAFPATSTFDITFDTMRAANGWPPVRDRHGVAWFYGWVDAALVAGAAVLVVRWVRLGARRRRWAERGRAARRGSVIAWTMLDGVLPAAALIGVPYVATGLTDPREAWARLWTAVPDLTAALLALSVAGLALGIAGLVTSRRDERA